MKDDETPPKPKTIDFDAADLKTILGIDAANEELKKKWTDLVDSNNKYYERAAIEALINKVNGTKKGDFVKHIRAHNSITETDDDAAWKKFFSDKPVDEIIKAIISHGLENADDLKKAVQDAKADKGTDELGIDWSKYGDGKEPTEDGKTNKGGLIAYLYDKEISKAIDYLKKEQDKTPKKDNDEQSHLAKYKWWYAGGGVILVIVVLAAVFWSSIMNWWNGPSEEEGSAGEKENE